MTVMPPRPSRNDRSIWQSAVVALAKDCAEWGGEHAGEWEKLLLRCYLNGNGFEIAKELDDQHVDGIDAELVEILDSASSYIWSAEDAAVKAWAAEHGLQPTLSVGDRATCKWGEGVISGIDGGQARYTFVPDDDRERFKGGGGICVAYEDAIGIAARSGETAQTGSTEGKSPAIAQKDLP